MESDADLLAMRVGPKTEQQLLHESSGSLSTLLLNDAVAKYDSKPRAQDKLHAAKELVRRSLRCVPQNLVGAA